MTPTRPALRAIHDTFTDPLPERLFPPLATGVHWGLERTTAALAELGDPHHAYPTIHVGGTNGKGSVAATVAAVLSAEGRRVGLYTSPHLVHFRERFQIGGCPLEDEALARHADQVRGAVARSALSFFEAATVLGLHAFACEQVDVAVVEVGLGGRLDATNVIRPVCAAVTNVALDHAEYLGSTLDAVAREKAGIVKAGVPFVTAEADPVVLELLRAAAKDRGAPFMALDPVSDLHRLEVTREGTAFSLETRSWGGLSLTTPLIGRHQALNAALAVSLLEHLPEPLRPGKVGIRRGLAGVRWPGRDQIERGSDVTWLFDAAHNTAGILSLVDVLDRLDLPRPWVALLGVLGDKDWRAMLPPLLRRADLTILTDPPSAPPERRWNLEEAFRALAESRVGGPGSLVPCPDFGEALGRARRDGRDGTVLVTGSVHTVGCALRLLGTEPFPPFPPFPVVLSETGPGL